MTDCTKFPKRVRTSPWIKWHESGPADGLCPGFWQGCPAVFGCPFDPGCEYCYLRRIRSLHDSRLEEGEAPGCVLYPVEPSRTDFGANEVGFANYSALVRALCKQCDVGAAPVNWGESADSLACEGETGFLDALLDWYGGIEGDAVPVSILLTKSAGDGWLDWVLEQKPTDKIIFSFSVTTSNTWRRFEQVGGAPPVYHRTFAARHLVEAGWRVRMRFDPLTSRSGSGSGPCLTRYMIGDELVWPWENKGIWPELITLGTLRFTGKNAYSKHLIDQFGMTRSKEDPRYRLPVEQRVELYKAAVEAIGGRCTVALCKETAEMWSEVMGHAPDAGQMRCNCTA